MRPSIFAVGTFVALVAQTSLAQAQEPAPAPPPPPPTQTTAPPPPAPHGTNPEERPSHRVMTTVDAGREGVVLERHLTTEESSGRVIMFLPTRTTTDTWERVCVTPCKVELPKYDSYRIARANGVTPTREFTLPQSKDPLKLDVDPGNLFQARIARVLVSTGTAALIVGGALITTASGFDAEKDVRLGGIITAGAGLLLVAVGIPLAIGAKTHVTADGAKVAEAKKPRVQVTPGGLVF